MSVFSGVAKDVRQLGSSFVGLGKNIGAATKPFGKSTAVAGASVVGLLMVPVMLVIKVARLPVQIVSGLFAKAPTLSMAMLAAGTTIGVTSYMRHRAEKRTQREMQEQLTGGAITQGTAPQQGVSYMNSASQADVDAKIAADRAAGTAPASQTAALAARQATAPEMASSPAV